MKKILISLATAMVLATSGVSIGFAQDGGPPQFRPVEMWACSYRDGKDQGDLDNIYEGLIEASGDTAYAAWHLNPYFAGNLSDQFDFLYLGAWADSSVMGGDVALATTTYADTNADWDEALDCNGLMFASATVQSIDAEPSGDGSFVLTVSDCNVADGRTAAQAMGALNRYNDYRVANGSTVGTFVWFPVFGGGNAEFDFKLVQAHSGGQALGDSLQWFVDNQAYNVRNSMMEGLLQCDEARMYNGSTIMDKLN